MTRHFESRFWVRLLVLVSAALWGALLWWLCFGSAPRYSFGPNESTGNAAFFPALTATAFIAGFGVGRGQEMGATLVGWALGLPALLSSPWTAPRGDNDGLWIFIVPYLFVFVALLGLVANWGRSARIWVDRRKPK